MSSPTGTMSAACAEWRLRLSLSPRTACSRSNLRAHGQDHCHGRMHGRRTSWFSSSAGAMRGLLHLLRNGQSLRHLPIIHPGDPLVRVLLSGLPRGVIDVSRDHVPVSLRPFIVGVHIEDGSASDRTGLTLDFYDRVERRRPLGSLALSPAGELPMSRGVLGLFGTRLLRNDSSGRLERWRRYALAWQHARRSAARGDRLQMSARDLRSLNTYYMAARPVYLVSVRHRERINLFPMDLVGGISSGEFLLALRATSPSIELIEESRHVAMSAAPASLSRAAHDLGTQHHASGIDVSSLPFPTMPSPSFKLPVLAEAGFIREVRVREVHRIGSHVLF